MSSTFPRSLRIRKAREFSELRKKGKKVVTDHFVVFLAETDHKVSRLGISVSRKVGAATTRSRIKRLIREFFRQKVRKISPQGGFDVYVSVRHGRLPEDLAVVTKELENVLSRFENKNKPSS